jgi:hypothetical protein
VQIGLYLYAKERDMHQDDDRKWTGGLRFEGLASIVNVGIGFPYSMPLPDETHKWHSQSANSGFAGQNSRGSGSMPLSKTK